MKRFLDLILATLLLCILALSMFFIALIIKLTSSGPVFYCSDRIGKDSKIFKMFKFRTMHVNTPALATHLLENPEVFVTGIGKHLRKYSLDELPQLYNIIRGDMSFVGPRPALFNQYDLIELRSRKNICLKSVTASG